MVMNKKAQLVIYFIMLAVVVFIFALAFSKPLVDSTSTAMNASNLNCTNPDLSTPVKATCVVVDMGLFYFIGVIIAASIAVLSGKKTFYGILVAIFVFIAVISMILPLKDLIILLRDADHLACTTTTIVGAKLACIVTDIWLFYFFVAAIAAGATYFFITKVVKDG